MSISDQLREAIDDYGTLYAVHRDSGVAWASLNRFMKGERDLYLETVDRLCDLFGLELAEATRSKPKRRK